MAGRAYRILQGAGTGSVNAEDKGKTTLTTYPWPRARAEERNTVP
jgi:hypothetical protein